MEYNINKGIGRNVEFNGLQAQYLYFFVGGLLAIFLLLFFGVFTWGGSTLIPIQMLRGNYSMGVVPGWNLAFIQDVFLHALIPIQVPPVLDHQSQTYIFLI